MKILYHTCARYTVSHDSVLAWSQTHRRGNQENDLFTCFSQLLLFVAQPHKLHPPPESRNTQKQDSKRFIFEFYLEEV